MDETTDPALSDGGDATSVAAPPIQATPADSAAFPSIPPDFKMPDMSFGEMLKARLVQRLTGINPVEIQMHQAARQQAALEWFSAHQAEEEKASQVWASQAMKYDIDLQQMRNRVASMPDSQTKQQQMVVLAQREQHLQTLIGAAQQHQNQAQLLSQNIPGMMAAQRMPPQAAAGGKAGAQSFPVSPPTDTTFERPAYAGMTEPAGSPTTGPEQPFTPPAQPAAAAATPPPANGTTGNQVLDQFRTFLEGGGTHQGYGLPPSQVMGNRLIYSANGPGEADQIRQQLAKAATDLGEHDMPVFVQDNWERAKTASDQMLQWSKASDFAQSRANAYRTAQFSDKNENQLREMLAQATDPKSGDPEMANDIRLMLSVSADKRQGVIQDLIKRQEDQASYYSNMANAFKSGASELQRMASPGGSAPPPTGSPSSAQAEAFLQEYVAQRKWNSGALTSGQKAELRAALSSWQAGANAGQR